MSRIHDDLSMRASQLIDQATQIAQTATTESRNLTPDESQRFDALMADVESTQARLNSIREGEQRARDIEASFRPSSSSGLPGSYGDSGFSQWARSALVGQSFELARVAGAEGRAMALYRSGTAEQRAMSAAGGVGKDGVYGQLWEYAVATSQILQAGVNVITTSDGNTLPLPRVTVHATGASAAANAQITASDATLDTVDLSVTKSGYVTLVPTELLQDVTFDLEGYIARAAGRELGRIIAQTATTALTAGFTTTGAVGPTGVSGGLGSQSTAGQGADLLVDLFHSVSADYRNTAAWVMNDMMAAVLRKLKTSTGDQVWADSLIADEPSRILGKSVYINPFQAAPATGARSVYFGDWSALKVRIAGGIRFERSTDYAFVNDQVAFRALVRTGAVAVDANAVKSFQGGAS